MTAANPLYYYLNSLERFDAAELCQIIGTVSAMPEEEEPFQGFLLRGPKSTYEIQLYCASKPQKCSAIAQATQALGVINGGFWTDERKPLDWCIYQNELLTPLTNFARPTIYFGKETTYIGSADTSQCGDNLLQTGPFLIQQGQIHTDYSDYTLRSDQFDSDITKRRYPRSVFGIDATSYYFLVIDGRSPKTGGLFLHELADLCRQLGMHDAINLDGGASTTLIANQGLINEPRFSFYHNNRFFSARVPFHERKIPNALLLRKKC
jgi:hypothetical protein